MRIGVDVDGVLADFNRSFIERVCAVTKRDLFPVRPFDILTWDYPESYGYSNREVSAVWEDIKRDPTFWSGLPSFAGTFEALSMLRLREYNDGDEVYFITARPGYRPKQQTELWLRAHSGDPVWAPTVLISSDKAGCAKALRLDKYIDDKIDNVFDVCRISEATQTYLMDHTWNRTYDSEKDCVIRVRSVQEMFYR
jgi:5'(3')-deoxyribonucleotidase